jgi:hypothetical protein
MKSTHGHNNIFTGCGKRRVGLGVVSAGASMSAAPETDMRSENEKRLWLFCGASVVALHLVASSVDQARAHSLPAGTVHPQETSCFVAGTVVLMEDGSERPIEAIAPGDRVLGRRGRVNRVLGCERTELGRRRLYGFNGGPPFVTAEHPFLTAEGWKALDPEATRRETTHLLVDALRIGDRLCRGIVRCPGQQRSHRVLVFLQATVTLESIAAIDSGLATIVYNLRLDGDHSYVANGWIVHNKDNGEVNTVPDNGGPSADDADGGAAGSPLGGSSDAAATHGASPSSSARASGAPTPAASTPTPGGEHAPSEAPSTAVESILKEMGFTNSREAGLAPAGPPLSPDQEQTAIEHRWRERD